MGILLVLFAVFYLLTQGKIISSLFLGLGVSLILTAIYTYFLKKKLESILENFYSATVLLSENKENIGNLQTPITIYEEVEEVLKPLEEALLELKGRYESKFRELETSYESLMEKSSSLIRYLEQMKEGYLNIDDIPTGIDPIGAMGVALKESLEELKDRIQNAKVLLEEIRADFGELEHSIQDENLLQKLKAIEGIINKLEKELSFFK